MWKIIPILLLLLLGSCRYSPFETDIDCRDWYQDNLTRLKAAEAGAGDLSAFGVALLADLHNDMADTGKAVSRINLRNDIAFAVVLGDMTDFGIAQEFEWNCKALSALKVPRFYVIGNHDSISFGKEVFSKYFAPFDYAFSFRGVKLIFYNDNSYEFPDVPNYPWLEEEALVQEGEERRLTLGISHQPPIKDSHTAEEAAELREFLHEHEIDLTLHGHLEQFSYWRDEFGGRHHVTASVEDGRYSLLFVEEDGQTVLQDCTASCGEAVLQE